MATERFLDTIIEAAFGERGRPDIAWSVGEIGRGVPRELDVDPASLVPVELAHRYLVATSKGRDKAVAIAVEEFHRPERNGQPERSIFTLVAEPSPGPIDRHTVLDMRDQ